MANIIQRAIDKLVDRSLARRPEKAAETPLVMQSSYSSFIPATTSNSAILMYNWHRVVTIMEKVIQSNAIGKRFLEIIRDHVFGQGVEFKVQTTNDTLRPYLESINKLLRASWDHPRNNFDAVVPTWIFEDSAYGEVAIPVETNPVNGDCWFGYLPVKNIQVVNVSGFNFHDVLSLSVANFTFKNNDKKNEWKPIWVGAVDTVKAVRYNFEPFKLKADGSVEYDKESKLAVVNPDYGALAGQVFYFRSLNTLSTIRGVGDLFHSLDQILTFDQALIDMWNRYDTQGSIVWDLELTGGTQKDIDKYSEMDLPVGNKFFPHNEKVKLTPLAPALKAEDISSVVRTFMVILCGSVGIPEFAMGDGSQTNVATAYEQMPTLYAKYTNRRKVWQGRLQQMLRYVLERKNAAHMIQDEQGSVKQFTMKELQDFQISVEFKPFERNNGGEMASMLNQIVQTVELMQSKGWIMPETAGKVARQQMSGLGIEIDEAVESQALKDEAEKKAALKGTSDLTGKPVDYSAVAR